MNEITRLDTVQHYCDLFGIEALPVNKHSGLRQNATNPSRAQAIQSVRDSAEGHGVRDHELRKKHIRL